MDSVQLHEAHTDLLRAAVRVVDAGGAALTAPAGEWGFERVLAHVALVDAATLAAVSTVIAGANTVFDNRVALDTWTIDHVISLTGDTPALVDRIESLGQALCGVVADVLRDAELDTVVPSLLLSNDQLLVNEPTTVRDLIAGLADNELPGHTAQLLDLLP